MGKLGAGISMDWARVLTMSSVSGRQVCRRNLVATLTFYLSRVSMSTKNANNNNMAGKFAGHIIQN
jgi:hypothetical protein